MGIFIGFYDCRLEVHRQSISKNTRMIKKKPYQNKNGKIWWISTQDMFHTKGGKMTPVTINFKKKKKKARREIRSCSASCAFCERQLEDSCMVQHTFNKINEENFSHCIRPLICIYYGESTTSDKDQILFR